MGPQGMFGFIDMGFGLFTTRSGGGSVGRVGAEGPTDFFLNLNM